MIDDDVCTALANPIAHTQPASVGTRVATGTTCTAEASSAAVSVRLSSGRRLAFTYDSEAVRKRRANLIANRGMKSASTWDAN